MANSMYTWVQVENLDSGSKQKLEKLLSPESGSFSLNATTFSERYFDGNELSESYDKYSFRIDEYGAKWWYINDCYDNGDSMEFTIESAWSVPQTLLKKLRDKFVKDNPSVVIKGTYEDESYNPTGAFLYAKDYDDIEDTDIGEEDIDYEKLYEDDEYRESLDQKRFNLSDTLYESYTETLKENKDG
tara:strand:+ start:116 stop:676 length:561 start_codon:yes stop_codon:yes gene_type:complete